MRLTAKNLKTVYLKRYTAVKDKYGYITKGWSAAEPVKMTIEPAGGAVNAQIYGESLNYMLVGKYQGQAIKAAQSENIGACVYVGKDSEPDYEITAVQEYSTHKNITLKKRSDAK
ncbi:hypothetical protein [Lactobacillus delbrueckii]|uniref:hypothetical protein n=1 Tax=Lactobacillus delbrueckii TaxID=1584 RepID=UPI00177BDB52|nr:hypothetical protein [Lactobacillus delbrueckii]MBD5834712.1 hypothetical protein [Lactobacillus delbrueckii]